MDVFDLLARGELTELNAALAAAPGLAAGRNPSGASLLAWAHYVGQPDAVALIRPHLGPLDPHDAIIVGDLARLQAVLASGWDANALSADGFTPLGLAAFFNRPEIFDLLLQVTRDVDAAAANAQQVAAIHAATAVRNSGLVEKLLRAGADPNRRQAGGFTPLQAAGQHGDAVIAGLLVLFGADATLRNDQGQDAAAIARSAGHGWLADRLDALAKASPQS